MYPLLPFFHSLYSEAESFLTCPGGSKIMKKTLQNMIGYGTVPAATDELCLLLPWFRLCCAVSSAGLFLALGTLSRRKGLAPLVYASSGP